jgi:hypothetical protein
MKKNLIPLSALCIALFGCEHFDWSETPTVRGSGNTVSETRVVSQFDRVTVSGSGQMLIVQDDQESLTIQADDNLLPLIKSEVLEGQLKIGPEHVNLSPTKTIHYSLHLKNIKELQLSGSLAAAARALKADPLFLGISGSGKLQVQKLEAGDLKVQISGSGDIDLGGKVNRQDIHISGSGNYRAGNCESQDAVIHVSGSADATVWVHGALDAQVSGSGDIKYYGSPQTTSHVAGSGSVQALGNK